MLEASECEGDKRWKKSSIRPLEYVEAANEVYELDKENRRGEEEEEEKVEGARGIVKESNKSFFFGTWHFLCGCAKALLHKAKQLLKKKWTWLLS